MHPTPSTGEYIIFYIGAIFALALAVLVVLMFVRAIGNMVKRNKRRRAMRQQRLAASARNASAAEGTPERSGPRPPQ